MKKLLAFMLAFVMIFALAACGGDDVDSKTESSTAGTSSSAASSEEPSEEPSEDESKEESEDPVEESSEEETPLPEFVNHHMAYNVNVADMAPLQGATPSNTSIRFTKINEAPAYGDIVLFTKDYGKTIAAGSETYEDYAILVVEYKADKFLYFQKSMLEVGENADKAKTEIPEDGFVVAIHSAQKTYITRFASINKDLPMYLFGISLKPIKWEIEKTSTKMTIDGKFEEDKWGKFLVETIDYKNTTWDYSKFANGNYNRSAKMYMTYDDDNFYFAIVLDASSCIFLDNISSANAGNMWNKECIQVNVMNKPINDETVMQYYNMHANSNYLATKDIVRQYGFSGSKSGETFPHVWWGGTKPGFTGEAAVVRDDTNEQTIYEVSIPWSEVGVDLANADSFAFSISINSASSADGSWESIRMRDGGGIIGVNDVTKMATVTFKK
ncbi:hypothetical protein LJB90_01330 [Eubacteriales bacterium OttesenSCG-928-G02]|nr:hypothetical protein [Eubacteriales bacterium OttesenSCG-928-G02]